jgi:hypothetical protein
LGEALAAVERIERVVTMFNDHLDFQHQLRSKRKRKGVEIPSPLDLDDLHRRAEPAALHPVEILGAGAEASLLMVDRNEAYRYVEPWVGRLTDQPGHEDGVRGPGKREWSREAIPPRLRILLPADR